MKFPRGSDNWKWNVNNNKKNNKGEGTLFQ